MTLGYGPNIPAFATKAEVRAYVGASRAALITDDDDLDRLIARASELIYDATGKLATRAWDGLLLADYFGGYIDPLTLPTPLTRDDYRTGLSRAVSAQIEFWLEWGEDHAITGLVGSATSGRVSVSQLPGQVAPRALNHLATLGMPGSKVSIR